MVTHGRNLIALALATACVVGSVDLSTKHCPCPSGSGYLCDTVTQLCVSDEVDCAHRGCELFFGVDNPACVVADDAGVYFGAGQVLYQQAPTATSATTLATISVPPIQTCSLGSKRIYVSAGQLNSYIGLGVDRGDGGAYLTTPTLPFIDDLVGDDQNAAWTMAWKEKEAFRACDSPANCAGGVLIVPTDAGVQPNSGFEIIALDSTFVYWSASNAIQRVVRGSPNGPITNLVLENSQKITVGDNQIVWLDATNNLRHLTDAGGAPLADNAGSVSDIRIFEGYVYFLTSNAISRVPEGGGTVEMIIGGLTNATHLAVTHSWLYWTIAAPMNTGGGVWRHSLLP
jgi:hypothetical protein